MATPYPFPGGFQRRTRTSERMIRTTFNVVALGAFASAPVAAVALWLLLTNPVLANEVADSNSLMPLMRVLVVSVGKAIVAALAWL